MEDKGRGRDGGRGGKQVAQIFVSLTTGHCVVLRQVIEGGGGEKLKKEKGGEDTYDIIQRKDVDNDESKRKEIWGGAGRRGQERRGKGKGRRKAHPHFESGCCQSGSWRRRNGV